MQYLNSLRGASRQAVLLAASVMVTVATAGLAAGATVAKASTSHSTGSHAPNGVTGRLVIGGGNLPSAVVGQPYSYQFRITGGGAASWAPLSDLPAGLALDPTTGVLSGVPREAVNQHILVSASRGGAHPATGSTSVVLAVKPTANGAVSIWAANSHHPAPAPQVERAADGSVTVPASGVASSLYQAAYFQAVDNPKAPQHDLVNVLLADVAAQVFAMNPNASADSVESGLADLKTALSKATNPQVPASAGKGLPSFGPTLVPQLTGALGVMTAFAASGSVVGPAAMAVAKSVYDAYLKTSIATGVGFETGYAGFSDRSLYDVGDLTASGFHALVSGPAIEQAVACGQAIPACATVEDSLLTPVIHTGVGTTDSISVTQTPAQLQTADPTLKTMLSSQGLNVQLNSDGSLTVPSGGFDAMLTQAGNMNVSLTNSAAPMVQGLFAAQGDQTKPHNVSSQADTDLNTILPPFNLTLTGTLFDNGLADRLSLKGSTASSSKPLLDGSAVSQDLVTLFKAFSIDDTQDQVVSADLVGIVVDVATQQWGDAIKNIFGIIAAFTASTPPDEALKLAQQTQKMIQTVFKALTDDLNTIEKSIQNVQATLVDMFKTMALGFADIDFENHQVLAALSGVEVQLGQLEYQTDLTDADVVAFGQGQIQTQIQGTINRCLDLAARQLQPLDFAGFTSCASDFKTDALTSANNDVVEFTTAPPPTPTDTNLSSDGTVATTLQAHGTDPAANLAYLLRILNRWYGLGTDPSTLGSPVANPGVWSEVALGYRELLDEYPQFSAGSEPDLAAIEGPGQQIAQLISTLQQVDPTTFTNEAVHKVADNYLAAFNQYAADINAHNGGFLDAPAVGYGTPDAHNWAKYDPFGGIDQPVPSGDDPAQQVTSIPSCDGHGDPATLPTAQSWESSVDLPKSWQILYNLVGYTNDSLQPLTSPVCYSNFSDVTTNADCTIDPQSGGQECTWTETMSASLDVRFMGTDGHPHSIHHFDIPTDTFSCDSFTVPNFTTSCPFGTPTEDFGQWLFEHGGADQSLGNLLSNLGGSTQPATRDVLDSEATQIMNTEQSQAFKWELDAFNNPDTPDRSNALYLTDTANLTGALDLLQLLAQTLAPSVTLGNQALSDILYGQDQLPSTLKGPNNAFSIFNDQANGTATQTFAQYVSQQQGRVAELVSILDGYLASAQQTAAGTAAAARSTSAKVPPVGDLATANAPTLTYSVLAQLATGAKLDIDTVTVNSPGTQTSGLGTPVTKQLTATSSASAPITSWSAAGLPPGLSINAQSGKVSGTPSTTGTFSVTVKATDTVASVVHNSGQATFSWVITSKTPPVCGKQLIVRGGFESGLAPWAATPGVRIRTAQATPAFQGKWLARLGGRTAPRKDTLSQTVAIQPSCSNATLSFELRIISNDPKTKASDTLTVQVVSNSGKVLKTLATFSNKNAAGQYAKHSFSLKPFIGQKVSIRFASSETVKGHTTSFLIDNVAVPVR